MPQPDINGPTFGASFLPLPALDRLDQTGGNVGQADAAGPIGTNAPVQASIGTIPRSGVVKPAVIIRNLTPQGRTAVVADRVRNRALILAARPLAQPPHVRLPRAGQWFPQSTEAAIGALIVTARPVPSKPTVIIRNLTPSLRTTIVATPDRVTNRLLVTRVPRSLPAPRTLISLLRTRLDTDRFERRTNARVVLPARPLAQPPRVLIRTLRNRLDTDQFERRTNSRAVKPSRVLAKPPIPEIFTLRTRLDTDQFERRVGKRLVVPARPLAKPPHVFISVLPQRTATVVLERFHPRALIVNVPRALPKPRALSATGILEGSAPTADRVTNRISTRRVPFTPFATPAPTNRRFVYAEPQADGGLTLSVTLLNVPRGLSAPRVLIRTIAPWMRPAVVVTDRWRNRALIVNVPRTRLIRTDITLTAGIESLAVVADRWVNRTFVSPRRPTTAAPAPRVAYRRPPNIVDNGFVPANLPTQITSRPSPPPTVRMARPRWRQEVEPRLPHTHMSTRRVCFKASAPRVTVPRHQQPQSVLFLNASAHGDWAWELTGSAIQIAVTPAAASSHVIGFDEIVGRPKQTKGY